MYKTSRALSCQTFITRRCDHHPCVSVHSRKKSPFRTRARRINTHHTGAGTCDRDRFIGAGVHLLCLHDGREAFTTDREGGRRTGGRPAVAGRLLAATIRLLLMDMTTMRGGILGNDFVAPHGALCASLFCVFCVIYMWFEWYGLIGCLLIRTCNGACWYW